MPSAVTRKAPFPSITDGSTIDTTASTIGDRAGGLQHPDDQLALRVDDRQVVEVVVVEAELAERRDEHDLPELPPLSSDPWTRAAATIEPEISSVSNPKTVSARAETWRLKTCMARFLLRGSPRQPAASFRTTPSSRVPPIVAIAS